MAISCARLLNAASLHSSSSLPSDSTIANSATSKTRQRRSRLILAGYARVVCLLLCSALPALAATDTVTSTADDGSAGTLRSVLAAAAPGDTIIFSVTGTIKLSNSHVSLTLAQNVTISGPGASSLAIRGNQCIVFQVNPGVTATISGLTIEDGTAQGDLNGAGIVNNGTLNVSNSTFSNNFAIYDGGGIYNTGTLTVNNSTFYNNAATIQGGDGGGGIYNGGTTTVSDSTFNSNSTGAKGGGIYNNATLAVTNSTFYNNGAGSEGGGIYANGTTTVSFSTFGNNWAGNYTNQGSAVFNSSQGATTFKGTLMNGQEGDSCDNGGGTMISAGYNIEDGPSCSFNQPGDQSGGLTENLAFGSNGGSTQTFALPAGSTAIDAIPLSACADVNGIPVIADQRGVGRPQGANCDIGSFEVQQTPSANVCPNGQTSPAPCSAAITLQYYVPEGTTLSSTNPVLVVTQGAPGLDFTQANIDTCSGAGANSPTKANNCAEARPSSAGRSSARVSARSSSQTWGARLASANISAAVPSCGSGLQGPAYCDVQVTFAPTAPGVRMGAVTLTDSNGNIVVQSLISGIGQAPVVAFPGGPQLTVASPGFTGGVALDGFGNLFVSVYHSSQSSDIEEFPAAGGQLTLTTDVHYPYGMSVDGAGNVFVADSSNNRVIELPAGCSSSVCEITVPTNGLNNPSDVFMDGAGNLFIADSFNARVVEEPVLCLAGPCQTTAFSQANSYPAGVAVDGAGNLFTNDGLGNVFELSSGGTLTTLGSDFNDVSGQRLDAAGDLFVADYENVRVQEIPAGCTSNDCEVTVNNGGTPQGIAIDGLGDVYVATGGGQKVIELKRSQAPSLSFPTTNVGSASTAMTVEIQNVGDQPLAFASFTASTNFVVDSASTTCSTSTPLALGATCNVGVDFAPTTGGSLNGTLTLTDNALNTLPSAMQSIGLSGSGVQVYYQLTTTANPSNGGTVTPVSGPFAANSVVNLKASPNAGYVFSNWTGNVANANSASTTVTMSTAQSVTANFVAANMSVSPSSIAFGNVELCLTKKQEVTVKNNGTTKVQIGAVSFVDVVGNPADFTSHEYCGANLKAGASCTIAVKFAPDALTTDSATLNIVTSASGSPLQVPITATGTKNAKCKQY